ncbi:MAG: VOC family protein [Anaerolineae bacterium]|nr:VOC family protein [Anaerolineae bacterium]
MIIKFLSVMVDDQEKALHFYCDILGFQKMADIPMGSFRWLTVVSPDGIEGVELVLEPMNFAPASVYQKKLFEAGIPALALVTQDVQVEYERLTALGVKFLKAPENHGPIVACIFEDTCGNLINLVQPLM